MDVGRAGEAGTVDFQRKSFQNVKQFSTLYFHSLDKIFQSERLKHCQSLFKINKNVQSIKVKTKKSEKSRRRSRIWREVVETKMTMKCRSEWKFNLKMKINFQKYFNEASVSRFDFISYNTPRAPPGSPLPIQTKIFLNFIISLIMTEIVMKMYLI